MNRRNQQRLLAMLLVELLMVGLMYLVLRHVRAELDLVESLGEPFGEPPELSPPPLMVIDLTGDSKARDKFTARTQNLILTYNEYTCLRCPVFVRKAVQSIVHDPDFRQTSLQVLIADVSDPLGDLPNQLPRHNAVAFNMGHITVELKPCNHLLRLRPEIPLFINGFTDCVRQELSVKLRRAPRVISTMDEFRLVLDAEDYVFVHVGTDNTNRLILSTMDLRLNYPLLYVEDWELADQLGRKYRGGSLTRIEQYCVIRGDHLVDSLDPYQMKCLKLYPGQVAHRDVEMFFVAEKNQKLMVAPTFQQVWDHLRLGKSVALFVKHERSESEKYAKWVKLLMSEDSKSIANGVYNSTDFQLRYLADALNYTGYDFYPDNIYQIYPGEEHGFTIVRMRGEFNRWEYRRFLEHKKTDDHYDELERMIRENPENSAPIWRALTLAAVLGWVAVWLVGG